MIHNLSLVVYEFEKFGDIRLGAQGTFKTVPKTVQFVLAKEDLTLASLISIPEWENYYLSSSSFQGLNILLNSCCKSPVRCLRFADHTGLLSLSYNPVPLPCYRRYFLLLN